MDKSNDESKREYLDENSEIEKTFSEKNIYEIIETLDDLRGETGSEYMHTRFISTYEEIEIKVTIDLQIEKL